MNINSLLVRAPSNSSCSAGSYCQHTKYTGKSGHHERCANSCGFRFNCWTEPTEFCDTKHICTRCCITLVHKTRKCIKCSKDIPVSCKGICFTMNNDGVCRDCNICSRCNIPHYKTSSGLESQDVLNVCETCYKRHNIQVKCAVRKCKRRICINTLLVDENAEYFCGHRCCV
jgi:hypothetical protein